MRCEGCTDDISLTIQNGTGTYKCCYACACDLLYFKLTPKQFKKFLICGHNVDEFLLHDDFYTKGGKALQPHES